MSCGRGYISKPRLKCGHGNCYTANTLKDNSWHFISTCCLDLVEKKKVFYIIWKCILSFLKVYFFFQLLHANINVSESQGIGLCAMCYMFETFYNTLLLFSCQAMSDFLWPHCLQHASPLCPWPSPGVCPSSCPLNHWCHLTISPSVALFSFCLQIFPESGSFPMSGLFASGSQNTGASASESVLPKNI